MFSRYKDDCGSTLYAFIAGGGRLGQFKVKTSHGIPTSGWPDSSSLSVASAPIKTNHQSPSTMSDDIYRLTVGAAPASQWPLGFFVFRTTYNDQDIWERYMNHTYQHASRCVLKEPHGPEVLPFFQLTPIEDRTRLEGATKEAVWEMFTALLDEYPEGSRSRGIAPEGLRSTALSPRYNYCLYVDDECLQSFADLPKTKGPAVNGTANQLEEQHSPLGPDSFVVVLTDFPPDSDEEEIDEDEPYIEFWVETGLQLDTDENLREYYKQKEEGRYVAGDEGEEAERNEPVDPDYKWMRVRRHFIAEFFYEMSGGGGWDFNWGLCNSGAVKRAWYEAMWVDK